MNLFTPATFGGLFLILGSYQVFKGNIYASVFMFFIADLMWLFLAFSTGDIFGTIVVGIGMLFGLLAFLKMHHGFFNKSIRKE